VGSVQRQPREELPHKQDYRDDSNPSETMSFVTRSSRGHDDSCTFPDLYKSAPNLSVKNLVKSRVEGAPAGSLLPHLSGDIGNRSA